MVSQPHYQLLSSNRLSSDESISVLYHDFFDYPLSQKELAKWLPGKRLKLARARPRIETKDGYFFVAGRSQIVPLRVKKEQTSGDKMKLLSGAREVFEQNSNILFVGITGSLAMSSASVDSDIDLMVITKAGKLWQTRLQTLVKLRKLKINMRRAGERDERDKLCMNIWMDERDLKIKQKNPYIAHELAQIVPFVNRGGAYGRLLYKNRWILNYWPNAVAIKKNYSIKKTATVGLLETVAYYLQRIYMSRKITRETVTRTRAFFHPMDWSRKISAELSKRGVVYK